MRARITEGRIQGLREKEATRRPAGCETRMFGFRNENVITRFGQYKGRNHKESFMLPLK